MHWVVDFEGCGGGRVAGLGAAPVEEEGGCEEEGEEWDEDGGLEGGGDERVGPRTLWRWVQNSSTCGWRVVAQIVLPPIVFLWVFLD